MRLGCFQPLGLPEHFGVLPGCVGGFVQERFVFRRPLHGFGQLGQRFLLTLDLADDQDLGFAAQDMGHDPVGPGLAQAPLSGLGSFSSMSLAACASSSRALSFSPSRSWAMARSKSA